MIIIILIHFLLIITSFNGQDYCNEKNPFRILDGECAKFEYACYKENDPQCEELKNTCKNCPPSNITLTILQNILNINQNQSQTANKMINLSQEFKVLVSISIIINIILLMLILLILGIIYLVNRKYRIFVFRGSCGGKKNISNFEQNPLLHKIDRSSQENQALEKLIKNLITKLENNSTDVAFCTIQFHFDGIDQEPIELYVHNNHNIVQVKQQICAKLPHAKHDDYKIMKLKYNGIILNDDNQYLLENIDKSNTIVNCFIDSSMNASDIIVVKLQGKMRLPDIIQINKNQTIDQLKEMIGKIINLRDFTLFKEILNSKKQMKKTLLNLNSACIENELIDGDCIRIVQTVEGKLIIKSIFEKEFSIPAAFKNTNQVSSLITFVNSVHNFIPIDFVLFCNNQYLEEEKYICEYDICADSPVKICNIIKINGIEIDEKDCEKDGNWELYHATKTPTNMKILFKKYKNITRENWKSQDWMMNELKTFLLTENHERFIQLFGVYFDESLYVAMENMEKGTLRNYLQKNKNFERKLICKWSEQILEGLEYLHGKEVVHRDLNPSNILVNINIDLKLSSFNLSKYENIYRPASFYNNNDLLKALKVRYMAPELLSGGKYKFQCDIWSFGTVLVRIASGIDDRIVGNI